MNKLLILLLLIIIYYNNKKKSDNFNNNYDIETIEYVKNNINIFQSYLFSDNEYEHVQILYNMIKPKDFSTIIDMGCGTAEVSRIFKIINPTLNMIAITNSKVQYDLARKKSIKAILTDYHTVPLKNNSADIVMFLETIGYGNYIKLLEESIRLLKNNGIIFIKDFYNKRTEDVYDKNWDYTFLSTTKFENYIKNHKNLKIIKKIIFPDMIDRKRKYIDFFQSSELMKKIHTKNGITYDTDMSGLCLIIQVNK